MNPKISVITTVFNCENYISKSIRSILTQTFKDFEYIIVNDGSTDNTLNIINEISLSDKRIIVIDNRENLKRVKSLNTALEKACGKYIAIQDADDISLPERLHKQFSFLEENPDHVLVGSDVTVIDGKGNVLSKPVRPENNSEAKFSLLFRCTFANPSILFRKEIIDKYHLEYEEDFGNAEDFRIISLISRYGKVFNMKDNLILYREHPVNHTHINSRLIKKESMIIVKDNLAELGFKIKEEQADRVRKLITSKGMNKEFLYEDVKLIFKIIKKFQSRHYIYKNREIISLLKRMTKWLGKKNVISKSPYRALYISILTYYYKEIIFTKESSAGSRE